MSLKNLLTTENNFSISQPIRIGNTVCRAFKLNFCMTNQFVTLLMPTLNFMGADPLMQK